MKYYKFTIVILLSLLISACSKSVKSENTTHLRASWVATVEQLDWPKSVPVFTADRIATQKKELIAILDESVNMGMNAIIFQVKPNADAFYRSNILPWSAYLTGTLGQDPGYDPLDFIIKEAHKRNLKLHVWLNPYRVAMDTSKKTIHMLENTPPKAPKSVYSSHPDWIRTAYNLFVLDPGIPAVRAWIEDIVTEIVSNYDIDGIHFDDYFYYESTDSTVNDEKTYLAYGTAFSNKADWRRNNTYLLIQQLSKKIKTLKPHVEFGISPAGVWRNKKDDPKGSDTQAGLPNYDTAYADTRRWVQEELIDYIAPQIYWPVARKEASYDVIAKWWANVVQPTKTRLYIGMALYKVGKYNALEPDWSIDGGVPEIKRQLDLNESIPEIQGSILFRQGFLQEPETQKVVEYIKKRWRGL
ncbi:glycoside hydrolase family 10 protein [Candidatus Regiella endosymbiont of Tuberolachnus salignus]|uniref:glycoside hydrolase family 10 protein n=1 Tax=Candidatus Regiella endosymbiont of Tuberolachnus salignus TaxID=3077956 RepID=UPI0030D55FB0